MSTRNRFSGTATGSVLQTGVVEGDVHVISYARNDEIGVILKHEEDEVRLKVHTETWFYVTVVDRSHRTRLLQFGVESAAAGLKWEIIHEGAAVTDATLPAGGQVQVRLVVHCGSTAPMAGTDDLRVLVADKELAPDARVWWLSNTKRIIVEAVPALSVALAQPQGTVSSRGTYNTVLELANTGNTDLHGELEVSADFDRTKRSSWLPSRNFRFADESSFDLGLGDPPSSRRVRITLPKPGWLDRTWRIALSVTLSRDDVEPDPRCLTIEQSGLLSRLTSWGEITENRKRRTLAGWAVVPLALGVAFGVMITGRSSEAEAPPVQAGAATSSAPASEVATPVEYSAMPCEAGTSVLVLHSLEESNTAAHVRTLLDYETTMIEQRRPGVEALKDKTAKVTRRDATCPAVLGGEGPGKNTDERFTRFVWVGPFPSDDAAGMCEKLDKIAWKNCLPVHVA
ncbi:hypothetical protein ABZX92_36365 [Lentzea sp. NPDC006480]|uniref:hypothetical protein n=1 Tax=Lentzea sp. NPDC006480 TaxID=3157176 RepID=UPI0033BAD025